MKREEWLAALGRELEARGRTDLRDEVARFVPPDWQPAATGPTPAAAADFLVGLSDGSARPLPTDAERWATGDDPAALLALVRPRATARKARLFACACCRRLWPLLRDGRARRAVEVAERYADGGATAAELEVARAAATAPWEEAARAAYPAEVMGSQSDPAYPFVQAYRAAVQAASPDGSDAVFQVCVSAAAAVYHLEDYREDFPAEYAAVGVVAALAGAIRATWAFDGLPVLADALEEAGCGDPEILAHCRGPGPHAPGCWILDSLLGLS
jgi:hypothetical protein